jgi:cytochrome oxidase Cu insertion factor (SCO1/SenC/PrrC family)/thiol-disulfide isomerase/thioredoxin
MNLHGQPVRSGSPATDRRWRPPAWTLLLTVLLTIGAGLLALAPSALADGDPGSDVLVYQPLFLEADSGISVQQQAQLGDLLNTAAARHFPIRVAIIATRSDLGAITALWRNPRGYAQFLDIEISGAYSGPLVVVMPNGLGFSWPNHSTAAAYQALSRIPTGTGASRLVHTAQEAVTSLAAAAGVKLTASAQPAASSSAGPAASAPPATPSSTIQHSSGSGTDTAVTLVVVAVAAALLLGFLSRGLLKRWHPRPLRLRLPRHRLATTVGLTIVAGGLVVVLAAVGPPGSAQTDGLATNPNLDPGTSLAGPAPGFTLTDQFGRQVSLQSFRGKVVLLAFNDSECTTICPLTTTAMLDAKAMLGSAGAQVQLLGVDADPKATALEDVLSYSELHGMLHAWHFLTGSLPQLKHVWAQYHVEAAIQGGEISHTPALFVIDPQGRLAKLYMTQQSYSAVGQLGQLVAREASRLLPEHPAVHSNLSYSQIRGVAPSASVTLPRVHGGSLRLGPGSPHLYLFFATWDQEITSLAGQLEALNGYADAASSAGLPKLAAIDEGSVEPSASAVGQFLGTLRSPLRYPVAVDRSGRVADGYEVQGQPWLVLTSASGRILWDWEVSTSGWLSRNALIKQVRYALARAPKVPTTAASTHADLAGSPPALAQIHAQADDLLGGESELAARIRSLRGYPVVLNVWGSWCGPCQAEFGLLASASARYGRKVAFLGADVEDNTADARTFLTQHPVSYPSYQTEPDDLTAIIPQGIVGTPETIFFNRAGKIVHVQISEYLSQGAIDGDVLSYALGT